MRAKTQFSNLKELKSYIKNGSIGNQAKIELLLSEREGAESLLVSGAYGRGNNFSKSKTFAALSAMANYQINEMLQQICTRRGEGVNLVIPTASATLIDDQTLPIPTAPIMPSKAQAYPLPQNDNGNHAEAVNTTSSSSSSASSSSAKSTIPISGQIIASILEQDITAINYLQISELFKQLDIKQESLAIKELRNNLSSDNHALAKQVSSKLYQAISNKNHLNEIYGFFSEGLGLSLQALYIEDADILAHIRQHLLGNSGKLQDIHISHIAHFNEQLLQENPAALILKEDILRRSEILDSRPKLIKLLKILGANEESQKLCDHLSIEYPHSYLLIEKGLISGEDLASLECEDLAYFNNMLQKGERDALMLQEKLLTASEQVLQSLESRFSCYKGLCLETPAYLALSDFYTNICLGEHFNSLGVTNRSIQSNFRKEARDNFLSASRDKEIVQGGVVNTFKDAVTGRDVDALNACIDDFIALENTGKKAEYLLGLGRSDKTFINKCDAEKFKGYIFPQIQEVLEQSQAKYGGSQIGEYRTSSAGGGRTQGLGGNSITTPALIQRRTPQRDRKAVISEEAYKLNEQLLKADEEKMLGGEVWSNAYHNMPYVDRITDSTFSSSTRGIIDTTDTINTFKDAVTGRDVDALNACIDDFIALENTGKKAECLLDLKKLDYTFIKQNELAKYKNDLLPSIAAAKEAAISR